MVRLTRARSQQNVAPADQMDVVQEPQLVGDDPNGGPTPMEGVAAVVDGQPADDPLKGEFSWTLPNFVDLPGKDGVRSEPFEAGGYEWQLLCFPRGCGTAHPNWLSLFLAVAEPPPGAPLWAGRTASFALTLVNADPAKSVTKEAQHNFEPAHNDWGFTQFKAAGEVLDPASGFVHADGALRVRVAVTVRAPDAGPGCTSRRDTGYVGLRNQGATCYMNSLLQTLYSVNAFRRAVYHMPTDEDAAPSASMPLALQGVFFRLQYGEGPASTKDLTASFGWDTADAFQQHDVQELLRVLCDRLEQKMKGTRVEGTVNRLFEGHTVSYVECLNVDFRSERKEPFQDLQLDVRGCATLLDSFAKYCAAETLEGDNAYAAEGHGFQAARKGVLFADFPPVLQLQLKRFEYDFVKDVQVKINDRHEFPDELDLDGGPGGPRPFAAPGADRNVRNLYKLLAVLVHSGGVHGGHYYAYVRPDGRQWLRFDDERVERVEPARAVADNFGGDAEAPPPGGLGAPLRLARFSSAYMLVYVRASEWDAVMCDVSEADISAHVAARLKAEAAEKEARARERAEAHLYSLVRVATDADARAQVGRDRFFDLVSMDAVGMQLKVSKKAPFSDVQRMVADASGVPVASQRLWRWAKRQNGTYRPSAPLAAEEAARPVAAVQEAAAARAGTRGGPAGEAARLDLYLETPRDGGRLPELPKTSFSLFVKQFLPGAEPALAYRGRVVVPKAGRVADLLPVLRRLGGLPDGAAVEAYEEVKFEPEAMIDRVDPETTWAAAQIDDGDIVVFQAAPAAGEAARLAPRCARAPDFFKWVRARLAVNFRRLDPVHHDLAAAGGHAPIAPPAPAGRRGAAAAATAAAAPPPDEVSLDLTRGQTYAEVAAALAARLGLADPLRLRFTGENPYSRLAKPQPLRWAAADAGPDGVPRLPLEEMVGHPAAAAAPAAPPAATLFYEVLDLPLPEFERLVTHRVAFHKPAGGTVGEAAAVTARLPRDAAIADLLEQVRGALPPELRAEVGAHPLRLMEVYSWKVWQLFDPAAPVSALGDNAWHLRAEAVPPGQEGLADEGALHIHCLHVCEDGPPAAAGGGGAAAAAAAPAPAPRHLVFSDPWIMAVAEGETVGALRARVRAFLGVDAKEFATWRTVAMTSLAAPEPLADSVVLTERFQRADLGPAKLYGHAERPAIGFVHENRNPRRTHAHINRTPSTHAMADRQLKIKA